MTEINYDIVNRYTCESTKGDGGSGCSQPNDSLAVPIQEDYDAELVKETSCASVPSSIFNVYDERLRGRNGALLEYLGSFKHHGKATFDGPHLKAFSYFSHNHGDSWSFCENEVVLEQGGLYGGGCRRG